MGSQKKAKSSAKVKGKHTALTTKVRSKCIAGITAAAIILMAGTLTAATINDTTYTKSRADITAETPASAITEAANFSAPPAGWMEFLPLQSQTLPSQKITLSYKQALTDSPSPATASSDDRSSENTDSASNTDSALAPQTRSTLKKQEIIYPTVYTGPNTTSIKVENALFKTNLAYLAAVNLADYFSTRKALQYGELYEANPIMRPFVGNDLAFAAVKVGLTAGSFFILKSLYKKNKPLAWAVTIVSNLAVSYVVVNNLRMIDRVQAQPRSISQ